MLKFTLKVNISPLQRHKFPSSSIQCIKSAKFANIDSEQNRTEKPVELFTFFLSFFLFFLLTGKAIAGLFIIHIRLETDSFQISFQLVFYPFKHSSGYEVFPTQY
jgi:hypothetical protein